MLLLLTIVERSKCFEGRAELLKAKRYLCLGASIVTSSPPASIATLIECQTPSLIVTSEYSSVTPEPQF